MAIAAYNLIFIKKNIIFEILLFKIRIIGPIVEFDNNGNTFLLVL